MKYKLSAARRLNGVTVQQAAELSEISVERWKELEKGLSTISETELYRAAIALGVETDYIIDNKRRFRDSMLFSINAKTIPSFANEAYAYDLTLNTTVGEFSFQIPERFNPGDELIDWDEMSEDEKDGMRYPHISIYPIGYSEIVVDLRELKSWKMEEANGNAIPPAVYDLYSRLLANELDSELKEYAESVAQKYSMDKILDPLNAHVFNVEEGDLILPTADLVFDYDRRHTQKYVCGRDAEHEKHTIYLDRDVRSNAVISITFAAERNSHNVQERQNKWREMGCKYVESISHNDEEKAALWNEFYGEWKKLISADDKITICDERAAEKPWYEVTWREKETGEKECYEDFQPVGHLRTAQGMFEAETEEARDAVMLTAILNSLGKHSFGSMPYAIGIAAYAVDGYKCPWTSSTRYFLPHTYADNEVIMKEGYNTNPNPTIADIAKAVAEVYADIRNNYEILAWPRPLTPYEKWLYGITA